MTRSALSVEVHGGEVRYAVLKNVKRSGPVVEEYGDEVKPDAAQYGDDC